MTTDLLEREAVERKDLNLSLSGDALVSFISGASTNIGKETFYNMADEQKEALKTQHKVVLKKVRPFYTLMALPSGVNDVNKQLIALNLIENTLREVGLKDNEHDPTTKWENEIILQAISKIPVTRLFDFFLDLKDKKISNKRTIYIIKRWLYENKGKWGLWAVKYGSASHSKSIFKLLLRHYLKNGKPSKEKRLNIIYRYLQYKEVSDKLPSIVHDYEAVKKGNKNKLSKLPITVAEAFAKNKFGMDKDTFNDLFVKKGGQLTSKEKRIKSKSMEKSGVSTGLDVKKLDLFDLLLHLNAQDSLSKEERIEARKLIARKAKDQAKSMSISFDKVGLILDTSKSMYGSKKEAFHPLLKGLAISAVIKEISNSFKEYRMHDAKGLIPKLKDSSNYIDPIRKAIKDGCNTLIIVGDAYENSPWEGAFHQYLYVYKKKIDRKNKLSIIHLNPVFASEAMDVKALSNLAPQIGIRSVKGLNESMFLAVAKHNPIMAVKSYIKHLITLQNDKAKELMPKHIRKLTFKKVKLV